MKNEKVNLIKFKLKLIIKSILIGGCGGLVVSMYRICTSYAQKISLNIYNLMSRHFAYTILGILVFAIIGYIVGYSVEKEPMISGSGIPQIEGYLKGKLNIMHSFKILISKFINGVLAMGAGLSLGIEGPSIQLAASFAHGISSKLKLDKLESDYLYLSGAGSGLAAAFNAPFSGVMFVLEEVNKGFSTMLFITSVAACISSDLVTWIFFGKQYTLKINKLISIPPKYYILLVILGILIGVCGVIYNRGLIKTIDIFSNINCKTRYKMIISFLVAILFGMFVPQVLGGGDELINNLFSSGLTIKMAIILLSSKYIFSLISFAPNTPGGILFPILTLGSLVGIIFANASIFLVGINTNLINNIIILSMAGMFTSVVQAPITGIMLVFEMSGAFTQLGPSIVVCGVAYIIVNLLNCHPIYDSLLENKIKSANEIIILVLFIYFEKFYINNYHIDKTKNIL